MDSLVNLSSLEKMIKFIETDLNQCLQCEVNFGLALLLSAWTEFFGHLLTGKKASEESYNTWLRYMGQQYGELLDNKFDLYDRIRCGLVHEYTIKGSAKIFIEKGYPAIEIKNNVIYFNNWQYQQDFLNSMKRYLVDIRTDTKLQKNYSQFRKGKPIVI